MTLKEYREIMQGATAAPGKGKAKRKGGRHGKGNAPRRSPFAAARKPNETEARYNREVLKGEGLYEALSLRLPGGSRYTPDWITYDEDARRITCHEVKGAYRFASESRAVAVVRECTARFPFIKFVWATLETDGAWTIHKVN